MSDLATGVDQSTDESTCAVPKPKDTRSGIKPHALRERIVNVPQNAVGVIIGKQGRNIKEMRTAIGDDSIRIEAPKVTSEAVSVVPIKVFANSDEALDAAVQMILASVERHEDSERLFEGLLEVPTYLRGHILGPNGNTIKHWLSLVPEIKNISVSKPSDSSPVCTVSVKGTSERAIKFVEREIHFLQMLEDNVTKWRVYVPDEDLEDAKRFLCGVGCSFSIMVLRGGCRFKEIDLTGGGKSRKEMMEISKALCSQISEARPYHDMIVVPVHILVYHRALEIVTRVKAEISEQKPNGIADVTLDYRECCIFTNEPEPLEARKLAREIREETHKEYLKMMKH